MDTNTLNSIIGQDTDDSQIVETEEAKPKPIDETTVYCDEPGCDAAFSGTMARAQLGRHKSAKHGIKKESQTTKEVKKSEKLDTQIPTSSSYLEELLEGFAIPNRKGILLALKDDSQNIDELREALKSVRVDKNTADYIVKKYAVSVGKNVTDTGTPITEPQISPLKATVGMLNDSLQVQLLQNMLQPKQEAKNPEIEQMKIMMSRLEESNKALQNQLLQQQTDNKIASLQKSLEDTKRSYEGEMGSLSGNIKEFAQAMQNSQEKMNLQNENKFEKLLMEMKHEREVTGLKNQIEQAQSTKPLAEKFLERGESILNGVAMGTGRILDKSTNERAAIEKGMLASNLIQQGMPPDKVIELLNPQTRAPVPSAKAEYENLQKMTEKMEQKTPQPEPQAEATKPIDYSAHVDGAIKFNAEDK